jgi:hypothetical protein
MKKMIGERKLRREKNRLRGRCDTCRRVRILVNPLREAK